MKVQVRRGSIPCIPQLAQYLATFHSIAFLHPHGIFLQVSIKGKDAAKGWRTLSFREYKGQAICPGIFIPFTKGR